MINVLVVDDNGPVRKSLRSLLATAEDIKLVATAANGVEAVEKTRSLRPDVAVMDISMPLMDGIEATEHIRECCTLTRVIILFRECCTLTRVIILSSFKDPEYIGRALEVGAKGYVLKDTAAYDLLEGIRTIHGGKHYFSPQIAEIAEKHLTQKEDDSQVI